MDVGERFVQIEEFAHQNGYVFRREEERIVFDTASYPGTSPEVYEFYRPVEGGGWEICESNRGSVSVELTVSEESSVLLYFGLTINESVHRWPDEIKQFYDFEVTSLDDFPVVKPLFDKFLESRYWSVGEVRPHSMLLRQRGSVFDVFYVTPEGELNLIVAGHRSLGLGAFVLFNRAWSLQYADKYVDEYWSERVPDFESVYRTVLRLNPRKSV